MTDRWPPGVHRTPCNLLCADGTGKRLKRHRSLARVRIVAEHMVSAPPRRYKVAFLLVGTPPDNILSFLARNRTLPPAAACANMPRFSARKPRCNAGCEGLPPERRGLT